MVENHRVIILNTCIKMVNFLPRRIINLQYLKVYSQIKKKYVHNVAGIFPGGPGGPQSGENFANPPPPIDTCPLFWTKACPPPRFVPENLKNLNTF